MARTTGRYRITSTMGEQVHAFVPDPLPPANPPLAMHGPATELHAGALAALSRLAVAGTMVPTWRTTARPLPRFGCLSACPPIRW